MNELASGGIAGGPDPGALRVQRANLRAYLGWTGDSSDGARVLEFPGVMASVVPAAPQRSLVNSVAYDDAEALASAYDELARAYEEAGVKAWTVWAPQSDEEALALLRERGHKFDGEPLAMVMPLSAAPPGGELDADAEGTMAELGALNDAAYGYAEDGLAPAMARIGGTLPVRIYRARVDGETACAFATIDCGDDLAVHWVATPERFRGRGLASKLLARALAEARERGLRTSSLQASALGARIYERLGYRAAFRFNLYERREA